MARAGVDLQEVLPTWLNTDSYLVVLGSEKVEIQN